MRSPLAALLSLFAALCSAQTALDSPTIGAVENNYSYTLPGLPNYGIAQGSIFVMFGTNLANTPSALQAAPLQTTLDGVSVQVTVGGSTTQAFLYYVLPNQIAGVLPSSTPVGSGEIVVTNSGRASSPSPITVVQSAFGIATTYSSDPNYTFFGDVYAAAFDAGFNPLSYVNAANPGETIAIFGTGVGPIPTNDAVTPPVQNFSGIPIEVDIGGVPSAVLYHGRSGYPGLDQINVTVPEGVSGCNVSVVVVSSGLVSNTAFLPISLQGRTCTNVVPGVVLPDTNQLEGTVVNTGQINIGRSVQFPSTVTADTATQIDEMASAVFYRNTGTDPAQPISVFVGGGSSQFVSLENCEVQTSFSLNPSAPATSQTSVAARALVPSAATPAELQTELNAGPAINFSDSMAKSSIAITPSDYYEGGLGCTGAANCPSLFLPASGGAIIINNGKGGPDIGAFAMQMTVAAPLVWSNMLQLPSTVDRSQGLTITWTGGNPSGVALITAGSSAKTSNGTVSAEVFCRVPNSTQQFTIPASALLALPPASGHVSIETSDQSQLFTAQGLNGAVVSVSVGDTLSVTFQ